MTTLQESLGPAFGRVTCDVVRTALAFEGLMSRVRRVVQAHLIHRPEQ
jgi:hypothetical protein